MAILVITLTSLSTTLTESSLPPRPTSRIARSTRASENIIKVASVENSK